MPEAMPGCIGGGEGGCNMMDWTEALGMPSVGLHRE